MTNLAILGLVSAFALGIWAASLASFAARMRGLIGVLLLVFPLYTGLIFLSVDQPGEHAFHWWVTGLFMVGIWWGAATLVGFLICTMFRRPID